MAPRKKPETKAQKGYMDPEAVKTIGLNQDAVIRLATFGSQSKVEQLFRHACITADRLNLRLRGVEPFSPVEAVGETNPTLPPIHDVMRWMDGLSRKHVDIGFFKSLYATVAGRLPDVVRKAIISRRG